VTRNLAGSQHCGPASFQLKAGTHSFTDDESSALGVVRSRKITEIRDLGTEVEVSEGVKQGEQVVLNPPIDLEDGSKIQVRASSMAKAAS
jgi:hypothetical protein